MCPDVLRRRMILRAFGGVRRDRYVIFQSMLQQIILLIRLGISPVTLFPRTSPS